MLTQQKLATVDLEPYRDCERLGDVLDRWIELNRPEDDRATALSIYRSIAPDRWQSTRATDRHKRFAVALLDELTTRSMDADDVISELYHTHRN